MDEDRVVTLDNDRQSLKQESSCLANITSCSLQHSAADAIPRENQVHMDSTDPEYRTLLAGKEDCGGQEYLACFRETASCAAPRA